MHPGDWSRSCGGKSYRRSVLGQALICRWFFRVVQHEYLDCALPRLEIQARVSQRSTQKNVYVRSGVVRWIVDQKIEMASKTGCVRDRVADNARDTFCKLVCRSVYTPKAVRQKADERLLSGVFRRTEFRTAFRYSQSVYRLFSLLAVDFQVEALGQ